MIGIIKSLFSNRVLWLSYLPYHHHLAGGMVADFHKVGT